MTISDGSEELAISFALNGEEVRSVVPVRRHLADFIRERGLTGTHLGCEHGSCGACTIRLNGSIVRGCITLAVQADRGRVDTIEGLTRSGDISDLQAKFVERNAAQCGFCTPGMLVTAHELLQTAEELTREDIREFLSGNICRCTGYEAIVSAIHDVWLARRSA